MERKQTGKNGVLRSLIGEPTPAKSSGMTYSLAAILSVVVAFFFLILVAMLGFAKEGYEETDWYLHCSYALGPLTILLIAVLIFRWTGWSVRAELRAQVCPARYFVIAILLQCGLLFHNFFCGEDRYTLRLPIAIERNNAAIHPG